MRGPETDEPGRAHFHYNRAEREAGLSDAVRNRQNGSFWRRNRHLLMILIDILVVCAVFVFLLPRLRAGGEELAGYRFQMKVVLFDGTLLCSLRVDGSEAERGGELEVLLRALPDGESVRLFDLLEAGKESIVRARIPYGGTEQELEALLQFDGDAVRLVSPIPEE